MSNQFVELAYKNIDSTFIINKDKIIYAGKVTGSNGYTHCIIYVEGYKNRMDGRNSIEVDYKLNELNRILNRRVENE